MLEKLKSEMDNLIKDYKLTKQNIIKKLKIKENFWKEKEIFLKDINSSKSNNRIDKKIYNQISTSVTNSMNLINTIPSNPLSDFAGSYISDKIKNTLSISKNNSDNKIDEKKNIPNILIDEDNEKLESIKKLIENKTNKKLDNYNNDNLNLDNKNSYNPYEDSSQILNLMKKNDTKDLDKTKQILFSLSDLMSNFSMKVVQHQEMTQQSKFYNFIFI